MQLQKNKILILGSSGLIGNTLAKYLAKKCYVILGISNKTKKENINVLKNISRVTTFDALDYKEFENSLNKFRPNIIINCIGVTKHVLSEFDISEIYYLNSTFPNLLSNWCIKKRSQLIHISTDCIFNGNKPGLRVIDQEIYGYSKFLGEKNIDTGLIIRTSTIGHELGSHYGLLDWFLSQENKVCGFKNAFFNGVTTLTLSKYIYKILNKIPNKKLILNLTSNRISKYDLLKITNSIYNCDKFITGTEMPKIDRTLFAVKQEKLVLIKKSWENQILETRNFHLQNV